MPVETTADTVVVALTHAPAFAHGLVRDLRVRWALEEIGRPYRAELLDAMVPRGEDYLAWQPFDQVPAFEQQGHRLFESGAILLYLGEQDERLLPATRDARWRAISWAFAALNSVEPTINQLLMVDVFLRGKPWAADASVS
jgi:glutathione S-transferase